MCRGLVSEVRPLDVRTALFPERDEFGVQCRLLVSAVHTAKRANNRERSFYGFSARQTVIKSLRIRQILIFSIR
jgi:hypothetical protein